MLQLLWDLCPPPRSPPGLLRSGTPLGLATSVMPTPGFARVPCISTLMFPLCSLATVSGGSGRSCWGSGVSLIPVPVFGGQNVLKTFEIAIRLNERPTRTGLERVFCRWIYFRLRSKIFFLPPFLPMDPPLVTRPSQCQVLGVRVIFCFFSVELNKLEFGCVHLLSSALYA